jgi:hypothetical protein
MVCWYQIAKDFAGPIATAIAAGTAATITYKFANIQADIAKGQAKTAEAAKEIARSQRDIAYDKLKHDLFERRYKLYSTAKEAIEVVLKGVNDRPIGDTALLRMRIELNEVIFFFPSREVAIFQTLDRLIGAHEAARYLWSISKEDDQIRMTQGNIMADALKDLMPIYENFQLMMQDELGFSQLRKSWKQAVQ